MYFQKSRGLFMQNCTGHGENIFLFRNLEINTKLTEFREIILDRLYSVTVFLVFV